jgi:4-aminobutyrate aminotransferase-like enzyme
METNRLSVQCGFAYHQPYLRLIEKLIPIMPDKSLDTFFFTNTGSEAIESAIKLARISTGRQNVITMQGLHCTTIVSHRLNYWVQAVSTGVRLVPCH